MTLIKTPLIIGGPSFSDKAIDNHAYLNNSYNFQEVNAIEKEVKYWMDTRNDP